MSHNPYCLSITVTKINACLKLTSGLEMNILELKLSVIRFYFIGLNLLVFFEYNPKVGFTTFENELKWNNNRQRIKL